jgi:hypothetical protein
LGSRNNDLAMDKDARVKGTRFPRVVCLTGWFEDYQNLYVYIFRNPTGIGFPDQESAETKTNLVREIVRIAEIDHVIREHLQWNIWRSWQVFSDKMCLNPVSYVPLLIDIDNEEQNLESAYSLTRDCLDWFESTDQHFMLDQLRVVFSGMKGFHIEARSTEPLDNQLLREALLIGLKEMGLEGSGTPNYFLNGIVDISHDFVRLTESSNSWREDRNLRRRRVIQFSVDDFRKLHIEDIVARSEAS